jgi:ABC-type polysaccharide/polyol phosphate transport system ATPase subunit
MIEADHISKVFRIYERPRHWLAEKIARRPRHREITALADVSVKIAPGECMGVIGRNGAGKSTLLRILAGISKPTGGTLSVKGRVSAILELDSGFHPEFSGRDNIRIGSAILGLSREEAIDKEDEIIEFSGLGEFIDFPVRTYSSGMYLRLGFSLATAVNPDTLLVDEALAVGDEWFRGKCVDRIMKIRDQGAAIVIVSHDLTLVRALCGRAALLEKGRVAVDGKPLDVINAYLESIYEEAASRAGKPVFPSDRPRRGTGEIEITSARMIGRDDNASTVFRTGEPMIIEFDYTAHEDCASPLFGANIFTSDGVLAVCTNSEASHYTNQKYWPGRPAGDHPQQISAGQKGSARFTVERNPLLEGSYELSVNVYRGRSGAHVPVDEILGVVRFQVVSGDHPDRGLLLCPGAWSIKEKSSP